MIQELEKDKWLCTLSQKKFKAPEFVRKHILNKFGENVEEVKMDVEFFNNYIRDDKRPSMPMAPPSLTNRGQEEPRQMKRPIEITTGRREFQVYIFSIRVEICGDRHERQSCKICAGCVNFPGEQRNFSHNLCRTSRFTHTKCDFALKL